MRRLGCVALVLLATVIAPSFAQAQERIRVVPSAVAKGQAFTVHGRGWPVIEFCSRTVRLSLRSAQNAFPLGTKRVRPDGRFRFTWVPRRAKVGAGRWRVVARMRCESGKDGSPVPVRRSAPLRIR